MQKKKQSKTNIEKYHNVESVCWNKPYTILYITIDSKEHRVKNILEISERLAKATAKERSVMDVCGYGYGIHWPLIDEDLSIDGLLNIPHKYPFPNKTQLKYKIEMYWSDEDNCYIAEVPELPGCMADGCSYAECLKNTEVVMKLWIETAKQAGWKIPKPKKK